ncbi:hypothetical protein BHE74_00022575 [Ensete ventricosum]|nr:hypothetical protein BHE74_00022575 [Ensete ventricosum]
MAGYVDPLVVGRVIGDVVDLFVPTISMTVSFGSKHVSNGCDIKPSMAGNPPSVHISGQQSDLYTLITLQLLDVLRIRVFLRWAGEEAVPYMGPAPRVGIHRYVLVLFQQKSRLPGVASPAARANFNTRWFAAQHDLSFPVATVYFNSQKEPVNRRR